jgi:zinc protease
MAVSAAMFPPDHPYHWPTIGSPDDLRAATLDEVQSFFRTYYHPANASLALAGDIDPGRAIDLAEAYFGDIPAGPIPATIEAEARLSRSRNLVFEDRVELPRIYITWHTPVLFAPDDAELDLAGDVLAHGKTSRLYRELVYDRRVATTVTASQHSRELAGTFQVAATAAAGVSLQTLADVIFDAVRELGRTGPTDLELSRARTQTEAQFIYRLQTIGDFGGKSDQLNAYNVYRGDPGYFEADRRRYQAATSESIRAAVSRWLSDAPSVTLNVVPRGRRELAVPGADEVQVS